MKYVDGYVLPVAKKNLPAYFRMSRMAGKVFRKHGALEFRECAGDDLKTKMALPFPSRIRLKPGETIVFSWIVFKSRADRDRINARVMKEPRIIAAMEQSVPFDPKRMLYGGFQVRVDL